MSFALSSCSRRGFVALTGAAALLALAPLDEARAQAWPSRPVTLVVPYGPGASNDTFTRALASLLSKRFGQPFVVENRPGAGGFTGTNYVANTTPDGYTFLEMPSGIASFGSVMDVKFNPTTDLAPVALFARAPTAMVVSASLPVKTVQEFVAYAKARPDQLFYGFAGIGTGQHQHAEMFKSATGLKIKGVNYKSSAEAQTDLVAGRLQLMLVTVASTLGQIQSGQLRLLAYADGNYPPGVPPAPTLKEAGVPNMEKAQTWWALFAPAKVPQEIVLKLNAAINDALKEPDFVSLLAKSGATPSPGAPQQLTDTLRQEIADLTDFAKSAGMIK